MSYKKRPEVLTGHTLFQETPCGTVYLTLNRDEKGNLFEIFPSMGKAGICASTMLEVIAILTSKLLRYGEKPEAIINKLEKIGCHNGPENSCIAIIAELIKKDEDKSK